MLVLPSEIMHEQARACLRMLVQGLAAQREPVVQVNAGAVRDFDSSALAVLLEFRRECLAQGKTLAVHGMSGRLADLAVLYGVAELLPAA